MNKAIESKTRNVALYAIAAMSIGCGSESTPPVVITETQAAPENIEPHRGKVDMVFNGEPQTLYGLACLSMSAFSLFTAQSADDTQLMKIRLKPHVNVNLEESFELTVDGERSRVTWRTTSPEVKTTGDKAYEISGVAEGLGWALGSDGNYKVDPALKPANTVAFQVIFSCP